MRNNPVYREWERQQNDPAHKAMLKELDRRQNDPSYRLIMKELDRQQNDPVYQNIRRFEEDVRNHRSGIEIYNSLERERQNIKILSEINRTDQLWKQALESDKLLRNNYLFEDTRKAATIYYASTNAITQRFIDNETLIPRNAKYIEQLTEPMKNHARFATETLNQLTKTGITNHEIRALRASLTLSNHQIAQLTSAITPIVVPPTDTFRVRPPRVKFNLLETQKKELLEQPEPISEDANYEDLALLTPSSELATDAIACITLYERCNESRRFKGEDLLFKPTSRGTLAAAQIVWIVADSKDRFDFFIDQLYMLFYEGTGATKIKLLKENGGVMEKEECDVIWDIKNLRSKRARHDIEHGSESDIKKKYREVVETHKRLGLNHFPQKPEEYRILQHNLLKNLKNFLTVVAERIEE